MDMIIYKLKKYFWVNLFLNMGLRDVIIVEQILGNED